MPTDQNILVELLKQGSLPVAVIFMLFLFIKALWKKQEEFYNKMSTLIEASLKNSNCIEENNKLLTEMLAKQDNLSNQMVIALNEFSTQLNNCAVNNEGGTKPSRKIKNYTLTK